MTTAAAATTAAEDTAAAAATTTAAAAAAMAATTTAVTTATTTAATVTAEGRGRQRASPDHLPLPIRPRSRYRHRAAVRSHPVAVGTPPRPATWLRHAQADHRAVPPPRPRARPAHPHNGSPFAALLYLCAALGVAVDSCGSLRAYGGLAAVVAALIIVLLLRHPPRFADQDNPDGRRQIVAALAPATQIQQKQPRLAPTLSFTGGILDAGQVAAAIRSCMAHNARLIAAVSPPPADSSDSDGGGSSTNGDEINNFWYPRVHLLEAGDVCLILPDFIQQLQEMDPGLTEAESLELLQRAFRDANKFDGFHRLSDIVEENRWIIYDGLHVLTDRSTGTSVMTMKITAKLIQLIWLELDGQNWKSCQEVKKECCFREVVGQSVEELLDVARSFSNASWSADHPLQMLTIFDALVDVLCTTFSSSEFMHGVFRKMVVDLRGMLEGTTSDMHSIRECAIHPATALLVRYLKFFYRNGDMMQFVLGDCTIELSLIYAWVSKLLSEDAEAMFPAANGQRYIYMLNNMDFVYQLKDHPGGCLSSVELQSGLCSLIHQYIQSYLDECWVPLVGYLGVDSRKIFLEEFFTICDSQATWKVRTMLKGTLRREIARLIVPNYVNLQENPSWYWASCLKARSETLYTAAWLEEKISGLFER